MRFILRSFFRKTWAYGVTIFLAFSLSFASFVMFNHFQEERALNIIRVTMGSCPYDIIVAKPSLILMSTKLEALEQCFSSNQFQGKFLPEGLRGKTFHVDKILDSIFDDFSIREGNSVVNFTGNVLIFKDDALAIKSLSKAFEVNFSKEALIITDPSYGTLEGILWTNGKTLPVYVPEMNSTILSKVVFISSPGMKAWWPWGGQNPLYLIMSESYFLKENKYTDSKGAPQIGFSVFGIFYGIKIEGLNFYPNIHDYINKVNTISRQFLSIGFKVDEPKVAAFTSAMKAISFLRELNEFESSIMALLSSFITAVIAAMIILATERKAKMLLRLGIRKTEVFKAYSLLIFLPLGSSFLLANFISERMYLPSKLLYLCYFIPSFVLSLYFVSAFVSRLYSGEEVFWRKVVATSLYGIIGVVVFGIVMFVGRLIVTERGFLGSIFGISLFYYICFLIVVPLLISVGIGLLKLKKGKILWTKIFKALVPKTYVSAILFLLILITSSFSMIAISAGAEKMMADYLAWKSVGADVVYSGPPQVILKEGKAYGPHVISFLEESSMYKLVINGRPQGYWGSFVTMSPTELRNYISCNRLPSFIKKPLQEIYREIKDNSSIVFLAGSTGIPMGKEVNVTLSPRLPGSPVLKNHVTLKARVLNITSIPLFEIGNKIIIPRKVFAYLTGQDISNYTFRICYVVFDKEPPLKKIYQMLQGHQIEITRQGIVNSILSRFSSSLSVLSVSSKTETITLSFLVLLVFGFLADNTRRNARSLERIGINKRTIISSYFLGFLAISAGAFFLFLGLSYVLMNLITMEMGALWTSPPPILEIVKYTWPSLVIPPLLALIVGAFVFRRWKNERNTSEGSEQDL